MKTFLEELGGRDAVELVVAAFYERVLADPKLKPFFRGVQMSRLYKHQIDFFCAALGGGDCYHGRDMRTIHAGMNIGDEEFDAVARHLMDAMRDCEVGEDQIARVIALIAPLRKDIVTRKEKPIPASPPVRKRAAHVGSGPIPMAAMPGVGSSPLAMSFYAPARPIAGAAPAFRWQYALLLGLLLALLAGLTIW